MTDQEIEKLREKLGSEYSVKRQNGAITVELVDIWNGVEFASHIFDDEVYRVSEIVGDKIWNTKGTWFSKKVANPSSESAYVEQLKAKAKELYGEIKSGDRFELENGFPNSYQFTKYGDSIFSYNQDLDKLTFGGYTLYRQGKWAKKVEKPIRLNVYADQSVDGKTQVGMTIKSEFPLNIKSRKEFLNHIEEAIESYLNKIP